MPITVDLSHNQVTELKEWEVESVEELDLGSNYIMFIGEERGGVQKFLVGCSQIV